MTTNVVELIGRPQLAKRWNMSSRGLIRWENDPQLNFPKAIIIRNKNYFVVDEVEAWARQRASSGSTAHCRANDDDVKAAKAAKAVDA